MHVVEHPPMPLPWSLALNLFHVRKCSAVGVGPAVEPVEDDNRHIGRPSMPGLGSTVKLVKGRTRAAVPANDAVDPGEEAGRRVAGCSQATNEDVIAFAVRVLYILDWNPI
jgi:hypothetical protein